MATTRINSMATTVDLPLQLRQHTSPTPTFDTLQTKQPQLNITSVALSPTPSTDDVRPDNTLVLHPSLITTDFDALRFQAAAFDQLLTTNNTNPPPQATSTLLISSPYNIPTHYLDLTPLTTPSRLFALALTALKPARPDYATAPYAQALDFDAVIELLRDLVKEEGGGFEWPETRFHVVVFRSQLKEDIDGEWLYKLDAESHREACESGGLLKYWFGKTDSSRRNLATCKPPFSLPHPLSLHNSQPILHIHPNLSSSTRDARLTHLRNRFLDRRRIRARRRVGAVACEGEEGGAGVV
jgi:hypothetical protein